MPVLIQVNAEYTLSWSTSEAAELLVLRTNVIFAQKQPYDGSNFSYGVAL